MHLTADDIQELFDAYETIRFDRLERNYSVVHEDVDFLKPLLEEWTIELTKIITSISALDPETLETKELSAEIVNMYASTRQILLILKTLRREVVTLNVEELRKELEEKVSHSLSTVINSILFAFHPNGNYVRNDHVTRATIADLELTRTEGKRLATRLAAHRTGVTESASLSMRIADLFLSSKVQFTIMCVCIVAMLAFEAFEFSVEMHFPTVKLFARSYSVFVATLWFQGIFMMRWQRSQDLTLLVMVWATLSNVWVYGFLLGILISSLLYAFPLWLLHVLFKDIDDKSVPERFSRRFSFSYAIAWSIVAIVLTHELIWLIGLVIWISYNVLIRESSYRFFRQTYDLIENIFSEGRGRLQREMYFVLSSSITAFIILTGILGNLSVSQAMDLLGFAANFSLILITILLAIQAVIPGINIWSSDSNARSRLREIHIMLRANRGLGGFMVSFFFLFVLSNFVRWMLLSAGEGDVHIASLDLQFMTRETGNAFDILRGSQYSQEVTLMFAFTVLLVICVSLLIYCMLLLYYMFSTASIFLFPMLDSLLSTPVFIDSISNAVSWEEEDKEKLQVEIVSTLTSCRKLNGYAIDQIALIDSLEPTDSAILSIHFLLDFPEKSEMYKVFKETVSLFYGRTSKANLPIQNINLSFYRETRDMGKHNIFAVQVNEEDFRFFERDIQGMSEQFKIERVFRAKLVSYVLPESQVF